jgi:hypothetical protein
MDKCGICCIEYIIEDYEYEICLMCSIYICKDCQILDDEYFNTYICILCSPKYNKGRVGDWFCMCCESYIVWEKLKDIVKMQCDKCYNKNTPIENRLILPHYKARPIIETHFIPDIAQLIFDYYYKQRRYYKGEH